MRTLKGKEFATGHRVSCSQGKMFAFSYSSSDIFLLCARQLQGRSAAAGAETGWLAAFGSNGGNNVSLRLGLNVVALAGLCIQPSSFRTKEIGSIKSALFVWPGKFGCWVQSFLSWGFKQRACVCSCPPQGGARFCFFLSHRIISFIPKPTR